MQRHFLWFAILPLLLSVSGVASGQVAPGAPSFAPQDCHGVDCVDLLNNNVSLNIPVMSKAGAVNFNLSLNGSYYISLNTTTTTWQPSQLLAAQFAPLTQASSYPGLDSSGHTIGTLALCPDEESHTTEFSGFYFVVGGTYHYLPTADFVDTTGCYQKSITDTVTDNSGYTATFTLAGLTALYDRAGNLIGTGSITDSNANSITFSSTSYTYTDTLGLTALTAGSGNFPNYTWTDVNNGSPQVSFTTSSTVHLKSVFGCSGVSDYDVTGQTLPSAINFPDGTSLGITYEGTSGYTGDYTGRLNQITLRSGGTVAYTYGGSNHGLNCTYQTVPTLTRTLGNGDTTTYTLAYSLISGSNYKATNTVIDPGGNKTVYTFTGLAATGNSSTYAQVVTEVQKYQGTSTLLTTDIYCYNTAFASCSTSSAPTAQVTGPIAEIVVFHQISGMSNYSATDTKYDAYGNVWYSALYDFGGATPVRTTTITYGSCSASCNTSSPTISSIGSNIQNRLGKVVTTQNGSTVAEANYTYDAHGNLLSTSVWNGSAFIGQTTANSYNPNGTIATSYDLANNGTTYAYTPSGYSDGSCTNYPFPTKVTNVGTGLNTQATYDCTGGAKLTNVDANGNTTKYGYETSGGAADPYWRVNSVTDPYSVVAYKIYPTGSSPDTAGSSFLVATGSIEANTLTTDGYGRPINSQTAQSPSATNYDTVSTYYWWNAGSNEIQTSQPCSAALLGTCALVHSAFFDALGRVQQTETTSNELFQHTYTQNDDLAVLTPAPAGENSKQVQTEYDGLGRVSKVCHIGTTTSTGSSTACSQNSGTANGATDVYSYLQGSGYTEVEIQRNAFQTRWTYYDGLGRLVQKRTPEGGTWYYVYDGSATCPVGYRGATGQLAEVKDPNGNALCYAYDSLNRVTGINANGTTCRHFYYDNSTGYSGTVPTGITLANQYGRMVEGATDKCTFGTLITDEWFAYDQDGRNSDMWESSYSVPSYYYHSHANFYANGAINTLQIANPSYHTFTYGLDGEGRWYSLTDTTASQNIVTSVKQFPANNPVVVNLTGTTPDNDAYTIDQYTGRVNQYVFSVGNTPTTLKGVLNWNADGTLGSLATTDGFDSGGSLTCADAYDDWARLVKFDCGSGNWGQQYAYDVYDNLTKTLLSGRTGTTWNPGYSSSTNQCSGCSFDSDGNTTADGGGNYWGWDEFSKQKWYNTSSAAPTCGTSGKCIIYDAFGHIVAYSSTTAWVDEWQMQGGALATLSASSLQTLRLPAPGGHGLVEVNPNTSGYNYLHGDWLGNARVLSSVVNNTEYDDRAYTPYGEQFTSYGLSASVYQRFAGMTADFNNGLQYEAQNRELSVVGRWLSPDPAGFGWNQYAYATNPNSETDPSGLCPWCGGGAGTGAGSMGQEGSSNGCSIDDGPPGVSCSGPNVPDPSLFGNLLYDLPGYQDPGAEAMHVYTSCLSNGFQCDANGNYQAQVNYSFSGGNGSVLEQQKELAAIQFGLQAFKHGDCSDALSCIQQTYDTMTVVPNAAGEPMLVGGNYQFSYDSIRINGQPVDPNEFGCLLSRCGIIDSLDYSTGNNHAPDSFHVDTANPLFFPIGSIIHFGWDIVGGNTAWWGNGIPRPWWN
jgi:RHS repeat-associated protein